MESIRNSAQTGPPSKTGYATSSPTATRPRGGDINTIASDRGSAI